MWSKILKGSCIGLCLVLSLSACDSGVVDAAEEQADGDLVEYTGNPCLEPWVIDRMKEHIKERAEEVIANKYGEGVFDASSIYSSEISFNYISQPTNLENGDLSCSADVTVSYVGDDGSKSDLATTYAKLVNTNIEYNSNPFANAFSGYNTKQELESLGVNEFNIGQFNNIAGNSFSTQMKYEIKTTYSESGEEQQSYEAEIGKPAAMLATIALLDRTIQNNNKAKDTAAQKNAEVVQDKPDNHPEVSEQVSVIEPEVEDSREYAEEDYYTEDDTDLEVLEPTADIVEEDAKY